MFRARRRSWRSSETVTGGKERHMATSTVEVFVAAFGNEDEADAAVKDFKAWIGKERSS